MRGRSPALAFASILFIIAGVSAARQQVHSIKGQEKLQAWARLVHEHEPGAWDDAAKAMAAWPLDNVRSTIVDLNELRSLLAQAGAGLKLVRYSEPAVDGRRPTGAFREIALDRVPALLGLADDGWSVNLGAASTTRLVSPGGTEFEVALRRLDREVTRFMKLAAMLHADVAILSPARSDGLAPPGWALGPLQSSVVLLRDGEAVGVGAAPVQWELGRAALDIVKPEPADTFVSLWYRATSAHLESGRSYAYAKAHLAHARVVLPRDAYMQFYSGVLQENLTAPPVQVAVRALEASGRYRFNVVSVPEQLRQAEAYLRRAIDLDAELTEAPLHLARVVGLLGRHEEAASELRRVLPVLTTDDSRYCAELFLGRDEQMLEHADEARAAFRRASALLPLAQSPYLALSQLARRHGDSVEALAAFAGVATLPALLSDRPDPWWTYDSSAFRDANALLIGLRAKALQERRLIAR